MREMGFIYAGMSAMTITVQTVVLAFLRKHRKDRTPLDNPTRLQRLLVLEKPGDGMLTMDGRPWLSTLWSFNMMVFIIAPPMAILNSYLWGVILAEAEGWSHDTGITFAQFSLGMLLNPFTSVNPTSTVGQVVALVAALYGFLFVNCILGVAAASRWIGRLMGLLPGGKRGFIFALLVVIPVCLTLLGILIGIAVSFIEGWSLKDGVFESLSIMVSGGNLSLSQDPITTIQGFFAAFVVMMYIITMSGAVIGIVGGHPAMTHLMVFLEGVEVGPEEPPADSTTDAKCVSPDATGKVDMAVQTDPMNGDLPLPTGEKSETALNACSQSQGPGAVMKDGPGPKMPASWLAEAKLNEIRSQAVSLAVIKKAEEEARRAVEQVLAEARKREQASVVVAGVSGEGTKVA
eukprot:TRINITY_DN20001_c0_g1_i6.p1 TRINITY_DN20001_c0_g1~~TRINITY_DN20001_c0_g1_i6.p1  ORF type:complete len:404 (-),score=80.11 TRINITY_DN20001_c0_g1_i6:282-1493(-)